MSAGLTPLRIWSAHSIARRNRPGLSTLGDHCFSETISPRIIEFYLRRLRKKRLHSQAPKLFMIAHVGSNMVPTPNLGRNETMLRIFAVALLAAKDRGVRRGPASDCDMRLWYRSRRSTIAVPEGAMVPWLDDACLHAVKRSHAQGRKLVT